MIQKIINTVLALGLIVLLAMHFVPSGTQYGTVNGVIYDGLAHWFGNALYVGTSQQFAVSNAGSLTLGTSGTATAGLNWSRCALIASTYSVTASTTVPMDCALTGASPNDFVMAQFGTTTVPTATVGGWRIVGASASSTAGYDTLQIRNDTGATAIIPAQIASSTNVLNLR